MRTNILLNDDLMQEAFRYSHAKNKRMLIEEVLHCFIAVKSAEARAATYQDRVRLLDRKLAGLTLRESPSTILRQDRERG